MTGPGQGLPTASPEHEAPDLRAVVLGLMAWMGGLGGFLLPRWLVCVAMGAWALTLLLRWRRGRPVVLGLAWFIAAAAVAGSATLRVEGVAASRLATLARERAFVAVVVRGDLRPCPQAGQVRLLHPHQSHHAAGHGRGATTPGRVPVLVIADERWLHVALGSVVRLEGRSAPSDGRDLAAVISSDRAPVVIQPADSVLDGAAAVRGGIRRAVGARERRSGSWSRPSSPATTRACRTSW